MSSEHSQNQCNEVHPTIEPTTTPGAVIPSAPNVLSLVPTSQTKLSVPNVVGTSSKADTNPPAKRTRSQVRKQQLYEKEKMRAKKSRLCQSETEEQLPSKPPGTTVTSPDDAITIKSVTPGMVARNIKFNTKSMVSVTLPVTESDEKLPPGVVDIFAKVEKDHNQADGKIIGGQTCSVAFPFMCFDSVQQAMLSSLHTTYYGKEYNQYLRIQEARELNELVVFHQAQFQQAVSDNPRSFSGISKLDGDDCESLDDSDIDILDDDRSYGSPVVSRSLSIQVDPDQFDSSNILPNQSQLSVKMRRILVQWMSEVCHEFKLSEATYHLSVTLLDNLLARGPKTTVHSEHRILMHQNRMYYGDEKQNFFVQRFEFQALGCACIWIASKIEDKTPPEIRDLEFISDYSVTPKTLLSIEARICEKLGFRLHRVTPFHFVHIYLRASRAYAVPCDHYIRDPTGPLLSLTLYLLELSRYSFRISDRPASLVAASCVYLARSTLGIRDTLESERTASNGAYWTKTLEYYTGYSTKDMTDTILTIHSIQVAAESSSIGVTPAYSTYKTEANFRVSTKTVRRVEDLGFETTCRHESLRTSQAYSVLLPAYLT